MIDAKLIPKFPVKKLKKDLERVDRQRVMAAKIASTKTAVEYKKKLKSEIMEGAPGGQQFDPLTMIAKKAGKGATTRTPLKRMRVGIRHFNDIDSENSRKTTVKFVGSWIGLAKIHQPGKTVTVSEKQRKLFARMGGELPKRSKFRKYFFLKKETAVFKIPSRPMIDPFWDRNSAAAAKRVQELYNLRIRGVKI